MDSDRVLGSNVYVALICADSVARDSHSFKDNVGVALQNGTVHKGSGVALVGVTAHIFLIRIGNDVPCQLPLHARGESAAAPAAETGIKDSLDNVLGLHFGDHLGKSLIAVGSDVFVYIFGIYNAAVTESNAVLLFIEVCFVKGLDSLIGNGLLVEIFCIDMTVNKVLPYDLGDLVLLDHRVERTLGVNDHNGSQRTKTEAARFDDLHPVAYAVLLYFLVQPFNDLSASRRGTARTAANQNLIFFICTGVGRFSADLDLSFNFITDSVKFFQRFLHLVLSSLVYFVNALPLSR